MIFKKTLKDCQPTQRIKTYLLLQISHCLNILHGNKKHTVNTWHQENSTKFANTWSYSLNLQLLLSIRIIALYYARTATPKQHISHVFSWIRHRTILTPWTYNSPKTTTKELSNSIHLTSNHAYIPQAIPKASDYNAASPPKSHNNRIFQFCILFDSIQRTRLLSKRHLQPGSASEKVSSRRIQYCRVNWPSLYHQFLSRSYSQEKTNAWDLLETFIALPAEPDGIPVRG